MYIQAIIESKRSWAEIQHQDITGHSTRWIPEEHVLPEHVVLRVEERHGAYFKDASDHNPEAFENVEDAFRYLHEQIHDPGSEYLRAVHELGNKLLGSTPYRVETLQDGPFEVGAIIQEATEYQDAVLVDCYPSRTEAYQNAIERAGINLT